MENTQKQHTVELLRECNAGVKMGIDAINDALPHTKSEGLRDLLEEGHRRHEELGETTHRLLARYHEGEQKPNVIATGMSHMKTEWKLTMNPTDAAVAKLISEGCSMGIRSLSEYLNCYSSASEEARELTERIIREEERMEHGLRAYL